MSALDVTLRRRLSIASGLKLAPHCVGCLTAIEDIPENAGLDWCPACLIEQDRLWQALQGAVAARNKIRADLAKAERETLDVAEKFQSSLKRFEERPQIPPARFTHDCSHCTYLGRFNEFDLYYCKQNNFVPTVVARFGNDGPEYKSGYEFASIDRELAEAVALARRRGLHR